MAIKELQTRIALKYDSYENWTKDQPEGSTVGKNLVLLAGEIGICEIPSANTDSNVAPTVLFKVGDGSKKFHELPWASAKAADVYSWAKAKTVAVEVIKVDGKDTEFLVFKDANNTEIPNTRVDLSRFATRAEVSEVASDVSQIKATLNGTTNGTIGKTLADLDARLDVIEGADTVAGSVAKALKDAKAYTDTREVEIKKYADQAEADALASAKSYTDEAVKTGNQAAAELSNHMSATNPHGITKSTIGLENVDNKSVATIKTEFTGAIASGNDGFAKGGDVYTAIENAQTAAANDAAAKVKALADNQVATNASNISQNTTNIGANTRAINTLVGTVEGDNAKSVRVIAAEETTKIVNGADAKYDTLKEIADFIMSDTTGAAKMANDITALQNIVKDGGTLEVRVDAVESQASGNASAITTLQNITAGFSGNEAIKSAIAAAQKAGTDAAAAVQNELDALELVVGDSNSGLVKQAAETAASLAELTGSTGRIAAVEGEVGTIKALVNDATKGNEKLRTDVNNLQTLTGDAAKGNTALYNELTRVAGLVDNTTTGLAATKAIADKNKTDIGDVTARVAEIEKDYLKAADEYIFNCGSSDTVVHTKKANA